MNTGPLAGAAVLVTRPQHQAAELIACIEQAGGEAFAFPVMDILPRDPDAVEADREQLPAADIVVFVSPNAVRYGLPAGPAATRLAAIGSGTAAALRAAGQNVAIAPANGHDSEALLAEPALQDVAGKTIRILRGDDGRALLGDCLRERGAQVDYLCVYHRRPHRHSSATLAALGERLRAGGLQFVVAMSVASLHNVLEQLPAADLAGSPRARLVTPSRRVIKTAGARVPRMPALLADSPRAEDMVAAMQRDWPARTDDAND